ncbi:MCE family protein [Nocardia higoensis]|uniref:MCE family protein n=1 Tax=Nocardia higoensis TaxID=228599 RepID=UPI001FE090E3|nr:MCE family protein [Nocardia higoensis]
MSTVVRVAVASAVAIAAGCAGDPFGAAVDTITVTARFDNAAGLYVGNTVAVLGMPVGEVKRIEPKGTHVEVTMAVDADVALPADVTAVTVSTSILTDRHVEFTPVYRGGPRLADDAHLGLDRTRTPIEFDRLLGVVDEMSGELQGGSRGEGPVAALLEVAAAATADNGPGMRAALDQLATALRLGTDGGAATGEDVARIVDQLAALARAAADNEQTIAEFGSAAGQLTDLLAELEIGAGDTGARINEIVQQATELLRNNRGTLQSTVANTDTVVRSLADYRRQLEEFVDLAPLLLNNAYNTFDQQNRGVRVHALLDKVFFDSQLVKEICNVLGLRQLGCATGTLSDFGPDFGITDMLTAMAGIPR